MTDSKNEDEAEIEDDVEALVTDEVDDEYDVAFKSNTKRAADFGSLMVSLKMVAEQMKGWTERGLLPDVEELEEKQDMLREALNESPTDELEPEENDFDAQMDDIVNYAEELLAHLDNLQSARSIVDSSHSRITRYEREFELLRPE